MKKITRRQAGKLLSQSLLAAGTVSLARDHAQQRPFTAQELTEIANEAANAGATFQLRGSYSLAASEVFFLLNSVAAEQSPSGLSLPFAPYGPSAAAFAPTITETTWSQFQRTAKDVAQQIEQTGSIPNAIWLGAYAIPPESYLKALASVAPALLRNEKPPATVKIEPAGLPAAKWVEQRIPTASGTGRFSPKASAPRK